MSARLDYYAVLGVDQTATADELKTAFREKAKAFHPDGSNGEGDPERFSRVTEAYEVLRDPERRARYDASFYDPPPKEARAKPIDPICCSKCGKVTAQPRYAVYWTVVSALIVTWRTPTQGIYCSFCAKAVAFRCSAISAVAGWWGMWGLFWTPLSIIRNSMGGEQPEGSATRLLWYNALAFLSQGKLATAHALARMVSRSGGDLANDAVELMRGLHQAGVPSDSPTFANAWRRGFGDFTTHGAMLAAVPLIIAFLVMADSQGVASDSHFYPSTSTSPPPSNVTFDEPSAGTVTRAEPEPPAMPTCDREVNDGTVLAGKLLEDDFGHGIEIKNGSAGPAIIKVRNAETGRLQVAFYVSENGQADVRSIPDGTYRIQYGVGDALAADCKSFAHLQGASEFPGTNTFKTEQVGDQRIVQQLSYTLYSVPAGNVRPDKLDPTAFAVD